VNDDRLVGLLSALRTERMDRHADQKIRARLENAWTAREDQRGLPSRFRRPALVIATAALFLGTASTTLNAAGDSPLYGLRVTIEDLAVPLHADPADREAYLLSLLDQRTSEAARLESTGNALAAGRVRDIERATLRMIQENHPPEPTAVQPAPTETPTPAPSATPTASPSPSPTPSPVPTATQAPATPRPSTPRPTASPVVTTKPPTPKPTSTATSQLVTFTGSMKNPDGTYATNVCISLSMGGSCLDVTGPTFSVTFSAKIGQSQTLYFLRSDGVKTYKATLTKTVSSTYVDVGTVLLRVQ
jgi:hypothetical protein